MKRIKRIIILGVTAAGLVAGVAVATPGLFVSASTPVRGRTAEPFKVEVDGALKLKTKRPIDVVDQTITIEPGGHTGWHSHPGPVLVVVKAGTFTLYDGDDPSCTPHVFNAGSAFVDEDGGHVHIGGPDLIQFATGCAGEAAPGCGCVCALRCASRWWRSCSRSRRVPAPRAPPSPGSTLAAAWSRST